MAPAVTAKVRRTPQFTCCPASTHLGQGLPQEGRRHQDNELQKQDGTSQQMREQDNERTVPQVHLSKRRVPPRGSTALRSVRRRSPAPPRGSQRNTGRC